MKVLTLAVSPRWLVVIILTAVFDLGAASVAQAVDGELDTSFSGDGKVTTPIGSDDDQPFAVATQSDGKIVVVGSSVVGSVPVFSVARYNVDGSLDTSFSGDGKVTTSTGANHARAVAVQADGKIVVAGYSGSSPTTFTLVRLNSDGTLDATFDTDGVVHTAFGGWWASGSAVAIQSDQKIVVAGRSSNGLNDDFAIARYNTDGTLDSTFDSDGKATTPIGASNDRANAIAIQSNGKIVLAGEADNNSNYDFALARFNSDGTLDDSFSGDGQLMTGIGVSDSAYGVAIQSDQKIVAAGESDPAGTYNYDFALARYNPDGTPDTTFEGDGDVTTPIGSATDAGRAIAIQPDGMLVVAGYAFSGLYGDFAVARYNTDGTLDSGFSGDGKTTAPIGTSTDDGRAMILQADGKIVVAGESKGSSNYDFALARFNVGQSNTSVSIKAPSKVSSGSKVAITGTIASSEAACRSGQPLALKKKTATVGTTTTSPSGTYRFTLKVRKTTSVQVTYAGNATCNASASSKKTIKAS